jgi:hypothetical protein
MVMKSPMLFARVTPEVIEVVKMECERLGITPSALVREAISQYLFKPGSALWTKSPPPPAPRCILPDCISPICTPDRCLAREIYCDGKTETASQINKR